MCLGSLVEGGVHVQHEARLQPMIRRPSTTGLLICARHICALHGMEHPRPFPLLCLVSSQLFDASLLWLTHGCPTSSRSVQNLCDRSLYNKF